MSIQFTLNGWHNHAQDVPIGLRLLYEACNHKSIAEELLVYGDRKMHATGNARGNT